MKNEESGGHPAQLSPANSAFCIGFLFALDQLTKWLVIRNIEFQDARPVIPGFFDLVHVHNTGAAFGSFHDSNTFFIVLSLATLCALAVSAWRGAFQEKWTRLGVALLASGVLGNVTDRFLHGHVIDFLSFDFHVPFANPWPSFNVADSCICVAAGLFMISSLRENKKPAR
jgi:signal peptidase II